MIGIPEKGPSLRSDGMLPPQTTNARGAPRRVGVEIEFAGLEVPKVAEVVASLFDGQAIRETDYEYRVPTTALGEFRIEVDFRLLKRLGKERAEQEQPPNPFEELSEDVLAALAKRVAPCEVISAPIPLEAVAKLDELVERLREAGALGTDQRLIYAFGVHFNPEAPTLEPEGLLAYLRAFAVLYEYLLRCLGIDPARRISPFVRPYPVSYVRRVLEAGYNPNLADLIDDYLEHNPTRNRALDMLPLFDYLDSARVRRVVDDPLIKPRPTFHYRLANSCIGTPGWHLTDEWRHWLVVERLAADRARLGALAEEYHAMLRKPLGDVFRRWGEVVEQRLRDAWDAP